MHRNQQPNQTASNKTDDRPDFSTILECVRTQRTRNIGNFACVHKMRWMILRNVEKTAWSRCHKTKQMTKYQYRCAGIDVSMSDGFHVQFMRRRTLQSDLVYFVCDYIEFPCLRRPESKWMIAFSPSGCIENNNILLLWPIPSFPKSKPNYLYLSCETDSARVVSSNSISDSRHPNIITTK